MKAFITGGAGFVGSNLIDRLIEKNDVTVYDNLSSGNKDFLQAHMDKPNFKLIKGELLDQQKLIQSIAGHDMVFHLAANPDIRFGVTVKNTDLDLQQGTLVTYNVLEAMRLNNVKKIAFSSSSVVYGETKVIPTPEDTGLLFPISLYGASKLASEGLISAFCHIFDMQCWIFRFANIIGKRQTHGIIFDFRHKLQQNPKELEILGDGKQKKSYLLVTECVDGVLFAVEHANDAINVFNLASTGQVEVNDIAKTVVQELGLKDVQFKYTGGSRGWLGDVPVMLLDTSKINKLGWKARLDSREAICQAAKDLLHPK